MLRITHVKVCIFGCLSLNYAKTTEQIVMKFDIQTSYELTEMIGHFSPHGNAGKVTHYQNLVAYTAKHLRTYKLSLLSVCLFTLLYTLKDILYKCCRTSKPLLARVYPTVCVVTVSTV